MNPQCSQKRLWERTHKIEYRKRIKYGRSSSLCDWFVVVAVVVPCKSVYVILNFCVFLGFNCIVCACVRAFGTYFYSFIAGVPQENQRPNLAKRDIDFTQEWRIRFLVLLFIFYVINFLWPDGKRKVRIFTQKTNKATRTEIATRRTDCLQRDTVSSVVVRLFIYTNRSWSQENNIVCLLFFSRVLRHPLYTRFRGDEKKRWMNFKRLCRCTDSLFFFF